MTDPMTPADLNAMLAEMRGRTERLLPGPWDWSAGSVLAKNYDGDIVEIFQRESNHVTTRNECAFIANARTDLPKLLAAVEAVVAVCDSEIEGVERHRAVLEPHRPCEAGARAALARGVLRALTDAIGGA